MIFINKSRGFPLIVIFFNLLKGQLVVNSTYTPTQLVNNILLGGGVQAFNITASGQPAQRGYFDATNTTLFTLYNMQTGVILSSGDIQVAVGPNNQGGATLPFGGYNGPGDPDLTALSGVTTWDASILEFDFIPKGDTIKFYYIFASEEYEEYVGSSFNDVFGFFLSGPGINGPYSNNSVNIALIPGTNTPVAINTVNYLNNATYYVNNTCCSNHPCPGGTGICSTNPQYIQFDGHTVKLLAKYPVICGDTYHIKLAIADGTDAVLDSGVFLEEGSFTSPGVNISIQLHTDDSVSLVEGCVGAEINISGNIVSQTTFHIDMWGQANPASDLTPIPDSIVVAPPFSDTSLLVWAINDGIWEAPETLWVSVWTVLCNDTVADTAMVIIKDTSIISLTTYKDTTIQCPCSPVGLKAKAFGGLPPYTYIWNDGSSFYFGDSITINPCSNTTVIALAQDSCGYASNYDTIVITVSPAPPITFSLPDTIIVHCWSDTLYTTVTNVQGGVPPYNYYWSTGSTSPSTSYLFLVDGKIYVTVDDACSSLPPTIDSIYVKNTYKPIKVNYPGDVVLECPGDTVTLITYFTDGVAPYIIKWVFPSYSEQNTLVGYDTILSDTAIYSTSTSGSYFVEIIDSCGRKVVDTFQIQVKQYPPLIIQSIPDTQICLGDTLKIPYYISGGAGGNVVSFSTPVYEIQNNSIVFLPTQEGTYTLSVEDKCENENSYSFKLSLEDCSPKIPNVITPEGDGYNDFLVIKNLEKFPENSIVIYDRWGIKVFEKSPYDNKWDGKDLNGKPLSDGTYYYIFKYPKGEIKGFVMVLRKKGK